MVIECLVKGGKPTQVFLNVLNLKLLSTPPPPCIKPHLPPLLFRSGERSFAPCSGE
jgi:hypothetical protein